MISKYFKITLLTLCVVLLNLPVTAQDADVSEEEISAPELESFVIDERRHGGGMAESGTWALNARLRIDDTIEGPQELIVQGSFEIHSPGLCYHTNERLIKGVFLLLIGERVFDKNGDYRYGQNILSSGYLTDTGLPIEGIDNELPSDVFGGKYRHPINRLILVPVEDLVLDRDEGVVRGDFLIDYKIKIDDVPHGYYKFSILPGIQLDDTHFTSLMNTDPAKENLNGNGGAALNIGLAPVGKPAAPHLPWVILPEVTQNGGCVARDDKDNFAVTKRAGVSKVAIIPPISPDGSQIRYRLEPALPFLQKTSQSPLMLDLTKGEISVSIRTPENHVINLGSAPTSAWDGPYISTGKDKFNFSFSSYGHHEIEVTGYILDRNGVKIEGGGTYDVYVAHNLDIRTVIKPGMPVKPKESLDLALRVFPPKPAKITVQKTFNPYSIKNKIDDESFEITCNRWGVYTPQANYLRKRWTAVEDIRFSREGEYRIDLIAEYEDENGSLYMGTKTLAGVVHDENDVEIRGEEPARRSTYPQGDKVLTLPPRINELVAFPPDAALIFDPDLRVVLTDTIREQRVLMGERTFDLPDGEIGVLPRSTAENTLAHHYPEKVDRRMYSYVSACAPDGNTMFVVKDGGPMTDELDTIRKKMNMQDGDFLQVYGSLVFRDYPLEKVYYSSIATGAFPQEGISNPTPVPYSDGQVSTFDSSTPFLHSFSYYPGAIIEKDKDFIPRFHVFPPTPGLAKVTLVFPNGEQGFLTYEVDERGFTSNLLGKPVKLWQEGAYQSRYSFYPNETNPEMITESDTGSGNTQFRFYVIKDTKSNNFAWDIPSNSEIELDQSLVLKSLLPKDAFTEGTAFYTLSFNDTVISENSVEFTGNGFELSINIPKIIEDALNLDMNDPYDTLEIGCFVKGVNQKGKNRFMASRLLLNQGRLQY